MANQNSKTQKSEVNNEGCKGNKSTNNKIKRQQPRKDSKSRRVNYDNERVSKMQKDTIGKRYPMPNRDKTSKDNDVSWYSKNPELLKAAASFPFASVLGRSIGDISQVIPGVMTFSWKPAFGTDGTAAPYALNQASRSYYSFEVHANSRNYNYTDQDLMILTIAGTQPFCMLAAMCRAYGYMKVYSEQDSYSPRQVIRAMGFDYDDLKKHLANMWFDINEMISRTGQIWIPNTMPLLKRWYWMNSNIYTDANSTLAQKYMYVQSRYLQYNETASNKGGCLLPLYLTEGSTGNLSYVEFAPGDATNVVYTWDQWKQAFDGLMDPLLNSEDRGIIFGDILNAFGKDQIYAMSPITPDLRVEPVYSQEVLTQFENCVATPFRPAGLVQDPNGGLIAAWESKPFAGVSTYNFNGVPLTAVLNFHHNSPVTPDEIVVATRSMTMGKISSPIVAGIDSTQINNPVAAGALNVVQTDNVPQTCGSEVINSIIIIQNITGTSLQWRQSTKYNELSSWGSSVGAVYAFDWSPAVYAYTFGTSPSSTTATSQIPNNVYMEFDNYTTVDVSVLRKLHDMSMYSLFGMPMF